MFQTLLFYMFCRGKISNGLHKWSLWEQGINPWHDTYRCEKCKRKKHTW